MSLLSLSYLAGILIYLDDLNLSMQGSSANHFFLVEMGEAFKNIFLWKHLAHGGNVGNFLILNEKLGDNDIRTKIGENIITYL